MKIIFMGSGDFALPTFRSIREDGHRIVMTVTQPPRPGGRGRAPTPTPINVAADEAGVPVLCPPNVNDPAVVDQLLSLDADLAYVAAFGQKIGPRLLGGFPAGIINLHASLLPALRGAAPIQWAVIRGLRETGVSVFRLVSQMDAGPILVQRRTAVRPDETAEELHDRLARVGCDAVRAALELLAADPRAPGTPQDPAAATLAPKLTKADGRISFDRGTCELANTIRGLWSWPGAQCRFLDAAGTREERVTIARAVPYEGRVAPAATPEECGRITPVLGVQTRDGAIAILEIKPAGGRLMTWQEFVNGRHVKPGDRFAALPPKALDP